MASRAATAATEEAPPAIIVCAWCEANGRARGAARSPSSPRWHAVSHDYARAQKAAGRASHGICPACRSLVQQAWGLGASTAVASATSGPRRRSA
ncbi:MAG: hypothetical protein ACRDJN_26875 [Chloroflexota bacterium]